MIATFTERAASTPSVTLKSDCSRLTVITVVKDRTICFVFLHCHDKESTESCIQIIT